MGYSQENQLKRKYRLIHHTKRIVRNKKYFLDKYIHNELPDKIKIN